MFPVVSYSECTAPCPVAGKGFNENHLQKSIELDTQASTPHPEPDFNTKPEFLLFLNPAYIFSIYK
jgi:hypothetical protein